MHNQIRSIEQAINARSLADNDGQEPTSDMLTIAHNWSQMSLKTYKGELLRKALLLAAAMVDFAHEEINPS
jgi:hypothetical protein